MIDVACRAQISTIAATSSLQPADADRVAVHHLGARVRVPHVASLELIAPPDRPGHAHDGIEKPASDPWIAGETARRPHRLARIRLNPPASSGPRSETGATS
jgi:hypothetical protein